jgi:hypothetical protein
MNIRSRKFIVVASIILVVVTVAVSIAILEWIEASQTYTFPAWMEKIYITKMSFDVTNKIITVTANNTGVSSVTINEVQVNNVTQTSVSPMFPSTIEAKSGVAYTITLSSLSSGHVYQVRLISIKGNTFLYTATAPS